MRSKIMLLVCLSLVPGWVLANGPPDRADPGTTPKRLLESDRRQLAGRILLQWGGYVEKNQAQDRRQWAAKLWPSLANADLDTLQRASKAVTYQGMRNALLGQRVDDQASDPLARNRSASTKALGGLAADLVFTPIAPCRIVDTRVNNDRLTAGVTRNLIASNPSGGFSDQGGSTGNCGIPDNPAALALSVTALNNASTGYLRVFPANGTSAQGSPVSMTRVNTTVNNDIIVAACQGCTSDLKVFSTANTHYAAFVTGYFMAPLATAPECLEQTGETAFGPAQTPVRLPVAECPAGYTKVARHIAGLGQVAQSSVYLGALYAYGLDGSTVASERAICCRVPGR